MSFASKFNKGSKFDVSTDGMEYVKLKDIGDSVLPLRAIYVNHKSIYGEDEAVFVSDTCCVNIPAHQMNVVNEILEDDNAIADIKAGKVGFKARCFESKKFKTTGWAPEFVDL